MTMRSRLRLQCTRTKRAPSKTPGPTTPGYGSPPPSWPSSTAQEWTPEQLSSSRTETLPKNEKLENEETMENKITYQNTSIVISLREKLYVEDRDQTAEPPDELPAHPGHRDRVSGDESSRPPAPASQAPCSAPAGTPRCPAACTRDSPPGTVLGGRGGGAKERTGEKIVSSHCKIQTYLK